MNYYIPPSLPMVFLKKKGFQPALQVQIEPLKCGKQTYCLDNVNQYLSMRPGFIEFGWIVSMLGSAIIKLHGHAVARTDDNELICVTPPETPLSYHNFVPDKSVAGLIVNQRLPTKAFSLVKNKVIERFVDLENQSDQARLNGDKFRLDKIDLEKRLLANNLALALKKHTGRNDPCFCGSGRKYKQCCQ